MEMIHKLNPYLMSFIAACIVYMGLLIHTNKNKTINDDDVKVLFHKESMIYAGAAGSITFAILYFMTKNSKSSIYMNNVMSTNTHTTSVLPNRPLSNQNSMTNSKINNKLNISSINVPDNMDGSVIGYTGERVMSDPFKN
jgi:hypothetical protein